MDATDLARWTRFAAKGGIGKCTALQDCVAQVQEDLMFLKDDEVVVLLQLQQEEQYLGYCEGVVGRFHGSAVRFHGKLKKPVFAKRQSTIGTPPSRPISLSPRSPPTSSAEPPSASGSKSVASSIASPPVSSLPVASTSDTPVAVNPAQPSRLSVSVSQPAAAQSRAAIPQNHSRTPSTASSASHYSNHSRSHDPALVPAHARKASTASSRSAYSSASHPSSRTHSRSNSILGSGSGSEDTHTQHVSIPPPPVPAAGSSQATPALTDGFSAHSSFLLTPTPAFSATSFSLGVGKAPASLFQGRARSGSEKLSPRTEAREMRRRSGSENALMPARRAEENEWGVGTGEEGMEQVAFVEEAKAEAPTTAASETSFRSVSVYSDASGEGEEGEEGQSASVVDMTGASTARLSVPSVRRSIVREDQSDEEGRGDRTSAISSEDDLSDGGFGIGMTLLREDEDDRDSEEDIEEAREEEEEEEEETAIGHVAPTDQDALKVPPRRPRTLGMRVMNPSSVSPSATESESDSEDGEDVTVMPTSVQVRSQAASASVRPFDLPSSSSTDTVLPASSYASSSAPIPPRPPLPTYPSSSTVDTRRTSSVAPTDDEHWESDADIYDDYRYSRYSTHYSGSPAQHSSRRASRGSTKSGRSRASERPPLPDEEWWKKSSPGAEGGDEGVGPQRKSLGSERSSVGKMSTGTGAERKSVASTGPLNLAQAPASSTTPFTRGAEVASTSKVVSHAPRREASRTPSPPSPGMVEVLMPATPLGLSIGMMNMTSPLTKAFRHSDDSKYSRESAVNDDDEEYQREEHKEETSILANRHLPSPGPEPGQRSRSRSPALASSIREKVENELRAMSPRLDGNLRMSAPQPHLSVLTSHSDHEPNVVVLNESPVSNESHASLSSPDGTHLRVGSPQSYTGSAPPSPLNPGFPPSPSTMASFASTPPLSIAKSPSPSPSTPRHPISPPAIPFTGVPPPGRPPAHMQYAQHPSSSPPLQQQQQQQRIIPPSESLHSALRLAGLQRASTIHGRTQTDLLTATGPVPISFLLPGMMPPPPPAGSQQGPIARPQPAAPPAPYGQFSPQVQNQVPSPVQESPSHSMSPPPQPQQAVGPINNSQTPVARPGMRRPMTVPAPAPGATSALSVNISPASSIASPVTSRTNSVQVLPPSVRAVATPPPASSASAVAPLPRANFFPKVGQIRPRSRSFSGYNSEITEKVSQSMGKRSQEEGSQPFRASTSGARPGSPSSKTPTQSQPSSPVMTPTRGKPGQASRPSHGPSPLSLPPTTNISQPTPQSPLMAHSAVPSSPITRIVPASVRSPDIPDTQPQRGTFRQAPSLVGVRSGPQAASTMTASSSVTFPSQRRDSGPSSTSGLAPEDDSSSLNPPSPLLAPMARQSHDSDRTHSSFNRSEMTSPPPFSNVSSSSSPMVRSSSLRSKISISALRVKGAARSIREGASETATSTNGPPTPPADEDTVQIKDLEFELVRPTVPRASSDLHRGEDIVDSKDVMSIRTTDLRQDSSSVRSGVLSPGGQSPSSDLRFPGGMDVSADSFASARKGKGAEANNSVQAHRDRELKWMSTINSSDAAQARKSKKIKKLLIDGVPSSVRYLVWAHISNSGSKKMPSVYSQLSKRRPALARDIERDVELSFPDHQHLRDPKGPLVSVLFAYIAMVPDLRYHRGLAIIAGHLLLQSPEEDAFWTFLAMMDSHLRPYFMPTSPQMGVDTNLFVKAVEAADPQLATRVFAELNVRPQELCGVWFSSVFAGTLPLEHLHRVWDLFFYEGVPFLFRVGLTILSLSRRHLLEFSKGSPASYTAYLLRPPPEALPADAEQFISQALAVKLKDDDIRKMRHKMEAAVKQQQQRAPRISTSQPSHPLIQGTRVRAS